MERKFKVGDKVRIVGRPCTGKEGIVIVSGVYDECASYDYAVDVGEGRPIAYDEHELELVKEVEMKASEKQVSGEHYKQFAIQPYKFCYDNKLNNLQSEAISYIVRAPLKNGTEDVKKAIHTLELWLEEMEDGN